MRETKDMINKQCTRCYKKYTLKTNDECYIHTCIPWMRNKDWSWKE